MDREPGNGSISERPLIGKSASFLEVQALIDRYASGKPSIRSFLLLGESGTGKELFARRIHHRARPEGSFVAVNCAAIVDTLFESELFGHEKGAFTGADRIRKGKFELAAKGVLFLDEIGDMPLHMQAKILRVMQERELERVGSNEPIKVDVIVVAATNRDVHKGVAKGLFRRDLLERFVVTITIPPLRERREDIPLLARHFLHKCSDDSVGRPPSISSGAMDLLQSMRYPGNIRELENLIARAFKHAEGDRITEEHIRASLDPSAISPMRSERASGSTVQKDTLLAAIKGIKATGRPGTSKPWRVNAGVINSLHRFLIVTGGDWFSRGELSHDLASHGRNGKDGYTAAGRYLKCLKSADIVEHNGEKSNKSSYRLHSRFIGGHRSPGGSSSDLSG